MASTVSELLRRRMMGSGLPYDAEVEYLESYGSQYINSGLIGGNDVGLYVIVSRLNTQDRQIIGSRESNGNTRFFIGNSYIGWRTYYGIGSSTTGIVYEWGLNYLNSSTFTENGGTARQLSDLGFTPTLPIFIFAINYAGDAQCWTGRIYAAKISRGTTIVMDLIPVRVGTTGYMYDKVSGQLFGNAGTGDFILGNDK